ncbi:MAG: tetratricopeptide repeat protein, partial [Candidatus Obscuribacterales bacterium]|nr:tetratricopeptide repeat protein [Candidatus Obscuribacterales bacterium]
MRNRICALTVTLMMSTMPVVAGESAGEGIRAYRAGDYAKAEQLYRKALTEETDNGQLAAIYRNLAILYGAQGKDGAEFTKKADELNPPDTPSYVHSNATSDTSKNGNRQSFINKSELNREIGAPANQNQSSQASNGNQDPARSNGLAPSAPMMTGFSTSQTYESTSIG